MSAFAKDPRESGFHGESAFDRGEVVKQIFARAASAHVDPFEALTQLVRQDAALGQQILLDTFES